MDKVLVTLMLIIAGVVCTMVVINAVYPAITGSAGAISDAASKIDDRIRCNIKIITIANQGADVYVWVKNVGATKIGGLNNSDIFFGPEGNFSRIPNGGAGSPIPYWEYAVENATQWSPTATLKITVHLGSTPSGTYFFKMVVPNGMADEKLYSTS